ncbi:MAG: hypothetical protein ABJA66_08235 [Actinomycetota bacterium]
MNKIIATLVLGLLLSFGVIDLAAHIITQQTDKEDRLEKSKKENMKEDRKQRKMKKHRRHHRRMMKK